MDSVAVKAFFERVSGDWDEARSSFHNEGVIDALVDRAEVGPGNRVLDVGTGTGFIAAGNATALGLDNVTLVECGRDALPLADDRVDAAVATMVLHHAPDPTAMITELRTERADLWLGSTAADVETSVARSRLVECGYASLGMQ